MILLGANRVRYESTGLYCKKCNYRYFNYFPVDLTDLNWLW